jgi:hypothetical protein
MTTSNNDNPPEGGIGNATPSERIDESFEFLDFDEQDREPEPANAKPADDKNGDDSETTEAEGQEVESPEGETEGHDEAEPEGEAAEKPEPTDDVIVKLPTGETVELAELKNGYMRDRDYRIKTTQVAETRRNLEAQATRITQTVDVLADFLAKQLPPEPDPALLYTDPQAHYRQRAIYDAAVGQIDAVIRLGQSPRDAVSELTQQQRAEVLATENAKLAERFPMTTKEAGRKEFFDRAMKAAQHFGLSPSDVQNETDHRRFALAYYASIGLEAVDAKQKAQQKVKNVPPVTPPKRQAQSSAVSAVKDNREAMKRLAKTGSIKDALSIDFD